MSKGSGSTRSSSASAPKGVGATSLSTTAALIEKKYGVSFQGSYDRDKLDRWEHTEVVVQSLNSMAKAGSATVKDVNGGADGFVVKGTNGLTVAVRRALFSSGREYEFNISGGGKFSGLPGSYKVSPKEAKKMAVDIINGKLRIPNNLDRTLKVKR